MAINFPSTAGQPTDGSYTYTVAGIAYSWDGSSWRAAGAGASATDKTLFSVTQNAAGTAALSYNSNSGVFSYTPPDLSGYLTAEADTLSAVTTRGATTTSAITTGGISVGTNQDINLGSSNEFQLSYESSVNGDYGTIANNSDGLIFRSNVVQFKNYTNAEVYLTAYVNSGVTLYYDNAAKFETTTNGATITGALTAGGLTYPTSNGTSGQVLTSDGAGNVTWNTPGGLQSRATAQLTQSIANNTAANVSFTTPKTYALLKIETSHAAWVTLYTDTTSRTNDASRTETTDPIPGSGVLAEVITSGATTQLISPGTIGYNSAGTGTTYAKIVNKSGATNTITVTLTYVQLED